MQEEGSPGSSLFAYGGERGCCFFAPRYLQRSSVSTPAELWDRIRAAGSGGGGFVAGGTSGWWKRGIKALMKIREWSELYAGPRWKTFIRRFNRSSGGRSGMFQYDPLSYALNFDEGGSATSEINPEFHLDFSSSYPATPLPPRRP